MRDVHVHFLHGRGGGYNMDFFEGFIKTAQNKGLDEIYLLNIPTNSMSLKKYTNQ